MTEAQFKLLDHLHTYAVIVPTGLRSLLGERSWSNVLRSFQNNGWIMDTILARRPDWGVAVEPVYCITRAGVNAYYAERRRQLVAGMAQEAQARAALGRP